MYENNILESNVTISLCMIVKDEEDTLKSCLDSVIGIADEIIIVDTGSMDQTKEIARKYTDKIYDFQWIDNFAVARNYSFIKATKSYILWLDADDIIQQNDKEAFIKLKQTLNPNVDSVSMLYHLGFDKQGNAISSLRRNRLLKRSNNFQWIGAVHEYLAVFGNIIYSDIGISHHKIKEPTNRNLNIYKKRLEMGEEFTPRDLFYYANELKDNKMYQESIQYYELFLSTEKGWVEDNISACNRLADCYFQLNNPAYELRYLFKSFEYDIPRADLCCRLGYFFISNNNYKLAIYWYELACQLKKPQNLLSQVNNSCFTWLPHLQLCVCYDRIGNYELAFGHNEIARNYRPDHPAIISNVKYLSKKLNLKA